MRVDAEKSLDRPGRWREAEKTFSGMTESVAKASSTLPANDRDGRATVFRLMFSWLRGLAQLRDPCIVRELGKRRQQLALHAEICRRFPTAKFDTGVRLIGYEPARLWLGELSTVCEAAILAFGDEVNGFGTIQIGQRSWIGPYNNLRASGDANITIGADCLISQFCTLVGTNHSMRRERPIMKQGPDPSRRGVVLRDDVWLGAGAAVLPGVTISQGAVIGANAVVTHDIPPYEIWAGVPAKRIGERS